MYDQAKDALERMGFHIVKTSEAGPLDETIAATRQKWYWDCIATKMTAVVFVRRVKTLTEELLDEDRERFVEEAGDLDTSMLPRGFQKGVAVLPIYFADEVTEAAAARCTEKPKIKFAYFYVPAAYDMSQQKAHYIESTPMWGALYYDKFRYVFRSLLEPSRAPAKEPLSKSGVVLTVLIFVLLAIQLGLLFGR